MRKEDSLPAGNAAAYLRSGHRAALALLPASRRGAGGARAAAGGTARLPGEAACRFCSAAALARVLS